MDLVPYIYHEVQARDGSMLCAQHCLNNLLQQNLYTAMDLADMATDLDRSENATLGAEEQRTTSQNMDDTGFFSISVLEKALQVFDLSLVRWRSPEMAAFQENPEHQAAFVLNLSSHWLPLRRFASSPNRWYNLNSFLQHPEWISPTYLKMVLQQAEEEGYSVFVVRSLTGAAQEEAMALSLLPECQADLIGLEIGDPTGRDGAMGNSSTYASVTRSNLPSSSTHSAPPKPATLDPSADPSDLVAASLERSRANLARFQREQAAAAMMDAPLRSRRRRQADVPDLFGDEGEADDAEFPEVQEESPEEQRRRREREARQREEAEMARAIAASLAESEARDTPTTAPGVPARTTSAAEPMDEDEELDDEAEEAFDFHHEARLYDDEDAQLQAAINASLQEQALPSDWKPPAVESAPVRSAERAAAVAPVEPVPTAEPVKTPEPETKEDAAVDEDEPEVQELSAEELRRKRLERFM